MKTWTMPKVMIEGFAANEHVAACEPIKPFTGDSKKYYLDWDYNDLYTNRERLYYNTNNNEYNISSSGDVELHKGYYPGVNLYTLKDGSNSPGGAVLSYLERNGDSISWVEFKKVGTYDIYARSSQHIYIYSGGTFHPDSGTVDKPFS